VDNATCVQCHQAQANAWANSHHAKAMARATPVSVLGDFGGMDFEHKGVVSHFFKKGDKYFVRTQGPDGKPADFEIAYTFGVDPLQQYLIELPGGKLQAFTVAWDILGKRWFHLLPGGEHTAGRLAALDRPRSERQHHVHRLSHDRIREALRRLVRHLFFTLVGDKRELSVVSWPRGGP